MEYKSKAVPTRSLLDPGFQYTPARLTTADNLMAKYRKPVEQETVVQIRRKAGAK